MNPRRLYRCRENRQIAGVAAGMAEYLEVDPTVIRIAWILSAFLGGFTILLYIILAFVIPLEPAGMPVIAAPAGADGVAPGAPIHVHERRSSDGGPGRAGLVLGVLFVVFGAIALVGPMFPGWAAGHYLGPAFVLALGVALLAGAVRRPAGGA
ncbi:MAG TPA: PspC domain-containing protein [Candidatus Sulfomarinibacteraceae bacterium]|nr:PspC domain-containing protein [Candidatus Sulfomarinibacteraceae bacterium]